MRPAYAHLTATGIIAAKSGPGFNEATHVVCAGEAKTEACIAL